ncbi:MAG TPA: HD domain-containing phosphohydrolase [Actinomycetota bacterium]|nr:HD domain-containing phosphohydrolase [Actinomycetota bacterium]
MIRNQEATLRTGAIRDVAHARLDVESDVAVLHDDVVPCRVLVVDDSMANVELLRRILSAAGYENVDGETDPRRVLDRFDDDPPDVILLDLHMPHLDGFGVLELLRARADASFVPIIVLTADATPEARLRALAAGATDFLTKPFDVSEVVLRVRNVTRTQRLYRQLEDLNSHLERRVLQRTSDLERAQLDTVERLALAAEYRDDNTGEHIARVGRTSAQLAAHLGLPASDLETIGHAATLHDVGKIGVRDSVLLKPGPLTEAEFALIRMHTDIGGRILSGATSPVLRAAETIARFHHERWDGTGYARVPGPDIPIQARVVSIADAFDAMTSDRPYQRARSAEEATQEIGRCAGSQFDPAIVEAFLSMHAVGALLSHERSRHA